MTCQCPKPRQEQSAAANRTLIATQGSKIPQGDTPVAQSWAHESKKEISERNM